MKREFLAAEGFTLTELLVTISIMAILAALLLPVLGRAKNSASKATDINNLRQIMTALQLYANDNSGAIVPPNGDDGGSVSTNSGWLYTPNMALPTPGRFTADTGLLWPTLRSSSLYVCPMDDPTAARYSKIDKKVEQRTARHLKKRWAFSPKPPPIAMHGSTR